MNPKVVKILSYSSASILLSIPFLYFYIIGGNVTSTREYPFQAAIFVIGQNNRMNFYCGGAVIGHNKILTAQHCLNSGNWFFTENDLFVYVGLDRLDQASSRRPYRVSRIFKHEDYNDGLENDLAILELEGSVQNAAIARLYLEELQKPYRGEFRTLGYGKTSPIIINSDGEIIQEGTNGNELKMAFFKETNRCLPKKFCLKPYDDSQNVCCGDSGGPLIIKNNGQDMIVGVLSGTQKKLIDEKDGKKVYNLCHEKKPRHFTRLSDYGSFIRRHIEI